MKSVTNQGRRRLLGLSSAITIAGFLGSSRHGFASMDDVNQAIAALGNGQEPLQNGVTLIIPEIAENGNSVAVSFEVDSPMTPEDHVNSVMILAPDNPNTEVAVFHFTPMNGVARATTRMRLATTQKVYAVARLSDGTLRMGTTHVRVTIGGCGA